ncbi:unnamed protein product [Urochloa decumbens]|uniref:F-box domain-containing protein n=1 Tax=Urochloa decumbens TaxID=240449 RepID=A0ABC9DIK1_9POAL
MAIDSGGGGGDGGGGEKRQRVDEQRDRCEAASPDAIPADGISALPDELRQRILTHLPLKDAIRTGAVARGWRGLWRCRWAHRSSVEIHLGSRDAPRRELDALAGEPRPRRRLDRLSLVADTCKLKSSELRRFTEYAAECGVEDLHIEMRKRTLEGKLNFHLPLASPLLARLSLRRIGVSNMYYKGAQPFRALEVILLHSVAITFRTFRNMMSLCPSLLTLDLRGCNFEYDFFWGIIWPKKLRSITFAESNGASTRLDLLPVGSMRSFRFSSSFHDTPFFLPGDAVLSDLYIRFSYSMLRVDATEFNEALPNDLSALTVLTICSNALPVASSSYDDGETAQLSKLSNLRSLRELHLLMSKMGDANLADIYMFLKTCQCHNLGRLFVQLPKFVYKPMESSQTIDVAREEPPEDGLDNLMMVKIMNFNWGRAEVQLVSFLLRKARSLHKLLIVSPNVTPPDMPSVDEADLLFLKEALANGKMMLSESDDAATQPYHSEVFIEL